MFHPPLMTYPTSFFSSSFSPCDYFNDLTNNFSLVLQIYCIRLTLTQAVSWSMPLRLLVLHSINIAVNGVVRPKQVLLILQPQGTSTVSTAAFK